MQIKSDIHQIELGFVNAYLLVEADGLVLIDAGTPASTKPIIAYIRSIGRQPQEIKALLLTHGDFDHIGALNALRADFPFKVYASQLAADSLLEGKASRSLNVGAVGRVVMKLMEKFMGKQVVIVDQVVGEGDVLPFAGGVQVVASPGHTPGHLSFYLSAQKVLLAGDSMRAKDAGLVAGDIKMITWDRGELFASIKKQSHLGAEVVGVGHGPVTTGVTEDKFPIDN